MTGVKDPTTRQLIEMVERVRVQLLNIRIMADAIVRCSESGPQTNGKGPHDA